MIMGSFFWVLDLGVFFLLVSFWDAFLVVGFSKDNIWVWVLFGSPAGMMICHLETQLRSRLPGGIGFIRRCAGAVELLIP